MDDMADQGREATAWVAQRLAAFDAVGLADGSPVWSMQASAMQASASALLLADWACYPQGPDRITPARASQIVDVFPRGVRLWLGRLADGRAIPVGYTAWHPIARSTFDRLATRLETVTDRAMAVPVGALDPDGAHILILNASIVPALRGTAHSRALMRSLAADLASVRTSGLAAFTVSADGARFCTRFGMRHVGDAHVAGTVEAMYARRGEVPW